MTNITKPFLRRFGRSGFSFPEIGLGTWTLSNRDFGNIDRKLSVEIILESVKMGICFIDTADIYGRGVVETLIGEVLEQNEVISKNVFIATKIGNDFRIKDKPSIKNFGYQYLTDAFEDCEIRLKHNVRLLHLHNPPTSVLKDGNLIESLQKFKRDNRFLMLGLSCDSIEDLKYACSLEIFETLQFPFNVFRQDMYLECEAELEKWGGAVIVRSPLEYGMLSGVLPPKSHLTPSDYRMRAWGIDEEKAKRSAARELDKLLKRDNRTLAQSALRFALLPPSVSVVIPGAHSIAQVRENISASQGVPRLSISELKEIDVILSGYGMASDAGRWIERTWAKKSTHDMDQRKDANSSDTDALFKPLMMNGFTLKNRFVRSGTTERAVDAKGHPTFEMTNILVPLAEGGSALVVTGFVATSLGSRASMSHAVLNNHDDLLAWKEILEPVKSRKASCKLCLQIGHGGKLALDEGAKNETDLEIVDSFCRTAELSFKAGFDAIQIHAAHGYLLSQRISQSVEGAAVLVSAIVERIRKVVGMPVLLKVNMSDFESGGATSEDAFRFATMMESENIAAIEWSGWVPSAPTYASPSREGQIDVDHEGFFYPFVRELKIKHPNMILGCCGGWRTASAMAATIKNNVMDFVSLSRPLIAEPDLPNRIRDGQLGAYCSGCNLCLNKGIRPVHCPAKKGTIKCE